MSILLRNTTTGDVTSTELFGIDLDLYLRENPDIVKVGIGTTANQPYYILLNETTEEFKSPYVNGNFVYNPGLTRLGVGTDNPQATLDVNGSLKFNGPFVNTGIVTFYGSAYFYNDVYFYDDVFLDRLQVGVATITKKLDIGIGGTVLTAIASTDLNIVGIAYTYYGNIGIGSTIPQQKLDVVGSIKIDKNIYDSINYPGSIGYYLSRDNDGIRWVQVNPMDAQGILVYNETSLIGTGQSFFGINLKTGRGSGINIDPVQAFVNPENPNIADVYVYDYWDFNSGGSIYRNSNVGINNDNPSYSIDVTGTANITQVLIVGGDVTFNSSTQSTTKDTGALVITNGGLGVEGNTNIGGNVSIGATLGVTGTTTLNDTLDVTGATTLNDTLQVGPSGTVITTTGIGSVGIGTYNPEFDIDLAKDVKFGKAIIDTNNNVGYDTNFYQTPRSVLTQVGVDDAGEIISGRFFDAANMIRLNLDFIAAEAVGYITSTDYSPSFSLTSGNYTSCKDDIKDILKAITIDITKGGNVQSVGAGRSYYNGNTLLYINDPTVKSASIAAIGAAATVARYVINNAIIPNSYQITPSGRGADAARLIQANKDFIAAEAVDRTFNNYPSLVMPNGYQNCVDDIKLILDAISYNLQFTGNDKVYDAAKFYIDNPGLLYSQKTESIYAYIRVVDVVNEIITNVTVTKISGTRNTFTQIKNLSITVDPATGSNTSPASCADTRSAIASFVGIVTNAIGVSTLPNRTPSTPLPIRQIKDLTLPNDNGTNLDSNGCSNVTSAIYTCANIVTTIINSGPNSVSVNNPDGKVIWAPAGADSRNLIWVSKYGNDDNGGKTEGDAKLTIGAACAIAEPGDTVMVRSGVYYENNPIGLRTDVSVSGQDLRLVTVVPKNLGKDVFHVRRGCLIENMNFACDTGQSNPGGGAVAFPPTDTALNAVSGYIAPGPATEGPSGRWRSPYVRNCTNFMSQSIGMKINGNHATASTIGADLKCMVCDSFTQYNEAGIGVSVTNNGYAQLVSIFTINCDIAIYCDTGGQCDLTNSNSSFGNYGLVADGLGALEFTATVGQEFIGGGDTIVFNDVKDASLNYRTPYDGQAVWFAIYANGSAITAPLQLLSNITVLNSASGYSAGSPPSITLVDISNGNITSPLGPEGIIAELSPTIDDTTGKITSIDIVNSGRNYLSTQVMRVAINGTVQSTADYIVTMSPIYYTVNSATTAASSGISTVIFNEFVPYSIGIGTGIQMKRISRILTSGHSFEYIGTGTDINTSTPQKGGIPKSENQVVARNGAQIPYTSTNQKGSFEIGSGIIIDQTTNTIRGRDFSRAIQAEVTPLILALR